jgi:hypothetical protein
VAEAVQVALGREELKLGELLAAVEAVEQFLEEACRDVWKLDVHYRRLFAAAASVLAVS